MLAGRALPGFEGRGCNFEGRVADLGLLIDPDETAGGDKHFGQCHEPITQPVRVNNASIHAYLLSTTYLLVVLPVACNKSVLICIFLAIHVRVQAVAMPSTITCIAEHQPRLLSSAQCACGTR